VKTIGREWRGLARPIGCALVLLALALDAVPAQAERISVTASPIPLNAGVPGESTIGALRYLGGVQLTSDTASFGGFSGLLLSEDGSRLIALSDRAFWLTAGVVYDSAGVLTGLSGAKLAPMKRAAGGAFDPEALAYLSRDVALLVASERAHRLVRYQLPITRNLSDPFLYDADALAAAAPRVMPAPAGFASMGKNEGIEALVPLGDGRVLAIEEGREEPPDAPSHAWLLSEDGSSASLKVTRSNRFRPTDAALLPNGDVLMLERRYTTLGGVAARLRRFAAQSIVAGATLEGEVVAELVPPVNVDNMEGLAVRQEGDRTILMLIADDNYNVFQRTLLLQFELIENAR